MKKISILILSVLLITGLFISCDNSSAIPSEELVTITFDDAQSRSLSAELDGFNKNALFWAYTATKTDGGLTSGATGDDNQVWIHEGDPGLGGQIPGFSQGKWKFTLYGYTDEAGTKLAYQGTNGNVTLTRDSLTSNKVIVTVNPIKDADIQGTLVIASEQVTFKSQKDNDTLPEGLSQSYKVTSLDGLIEYPLPEGKTNEWSLAPGAYNVTVNFINNNIVYGSGTVVATIYSNLTTKVSGELVELLTHVEFDSDLNPDVITKTVSSVQVSYSISEPVKVEKVGETKDTKVSAVVTAKAAKDYITSVAGEIEGATTDNTKVVFSLNVNTTEASSTGVTYDIGMSAVAMIKEGENNISQVTKQIERLTDAVTVQMQLQTGLTNVKVTHKTTEMAPLSSATDTLKNGYYYDIISGILTIRTDSFSPFKVEYTLPVSYAASVNDVKYTTLSAAVAAAKDGDTVKLVNDVELTETVSVNKGITLDLNGYSITGNDVRALHFTSGVSEITGTGSIKVMGGANIGVNSSVIRVGDGSDWSNPETGAVKLTIEENVTVETDACYAISVFGSKTKEEVVVKGKLLGLAGLGTSGNEKHSEYAPVIKLESTAKIKATEGYALYLPAAGSYEINGTIEGPGAICTKAGNLTIAIGDGAIITATGEAGMEHEGGFGNGPATKNYAVMVENNNSYGGPANVVINGGIINGSLGVYDDETYLPTDAQKGTITITGGTFSSDPSDYVAEGYEAVETAGEWIVNRKVFATIGDTPYYSLEEAITAANDGETITLNSNIAKTISEIEAACFTIDKAITIDGINTYALTLTGDFNNASGAEAYGIKISGSDSGKTVTLKNLTINATNIQRAVRTEGNIGVTIDNCNIITNGVGIHVKGANKAEIKNSRITVNVVDNAKFTAHLRTAVMVGGENADVTVTECTINASNSNKTEDTFTWCKGLYAGMSALNAELKVSDTKVTADYSIGIDGTNNNSKPSSITINSGEYTGTIGTPSGYSYKSLTIKGGIFTGVSDFSAFYGKTNDVARLVISGGTFPFNPDTKFLADGYSAINNNGVWTVTQTQN